MSPVAAEGQGVMFKVAARLGPPLLARLRQDERYVAAFLNKAHYQNVYAMELAEAAVVLDTLRTLMNAPGSAP